MRTVHVVTHPEATHHVDRVVGGWYDSRLTAAGERAAVAVAHALRSRIPGDASVEVFSSDLRRTAQTAAAIGAELDVTPVYDERLREKSYGAAGGRPQQWLDQRFVPPPAVGDRMAHDEGIPGAETRAAFARRVYAAMHAILDSRCANQIIVTHGGTLTFVLAAWIGMPLEATGYVAFHAPSGSITELCEDDFYHNRRIEALGDTRHLPAHP
ncbi:histidine phosphatase family protein [Nocardia sp. NPDC050799]|uniref:histidine phosphatase family protein n=1 Tax=Nocardia sp. NPDC050799 TaxID=3154842 RepID=UPI0033C222CA